MSVCVAALLITGCGDSGDDAADLGPGAVRTSDPESTFAPLVWLHRDERSRPVGARWFIARSVLWFGEDRGCEHQKVSVGRTLRAQQNAVVDYTFLTGLGHGPGYWREARVKNCSRARDVYRYYSNHLTRPHDPSPARRPDLFPNEGYYLDLVDGARSGEPLIRRGGRTAVGVPAYVERHPVAVDGGRGLRLTYWLLFGAEGERREGDWQRVDVMLRAGDDDEYLPKAVRVPDPGRPTRVLPWRDVKHATGTFGGAEHPVLLAARGSHALRGGRGGCGGCARWATWEYLLDAKSEPWYGFGGAWGDIGPTEQTTGPLGPRGTDWKQSNADALLAANARRRRDARRSAVVSTRDPVAAFAPVVNLHAREERFPISADRFVARATLKWRDGHCTGLQDVATGRIADPKTADPTVPRLTPELLGEAGAARMRAKGPRCAPRRGRTYATSELTRPYDSGRRAPGLPRDSGFYLDILTDSADGDPRFAWRRGQRFLIGALAYFDRRSALVPGGRGVVFSYWMLYGSSESPRSGGSQPVDLHEGDWERIDVLARPASGANRWLPQAVVLHGDGASRYLPWRQVRRDGSHPVLYGARSSHVLYGEPGRHRRVDRLARQRVVFGDDTAACKDCARWELWRGLRAVRREPWYGFGGGWGLAFRADRTSGPLGPR